MSKTTYSATHEGKTYTRTTDRIYTHVVLVRIIFDEFDMTGKKEMDVKYWEMRKEAEGLWCAEGWCGRPDLAMKKFNQMNGKTLRLDKGVIFHYEAAVVPVNP